VASKANNDKVDNHTEQQQYGTIYQLTVVTFPVWTVFTARCNLVQSAVLRSHVVCPSVC